MQVSDTFVPVWPHMRLQADLSLETGLTFRKKGKGRASRPGPPQDVSSGVAGHQQRDAHEDDDGNQPHHDLAEELLVHGDRSSR
ncbi:hypothetical protein GCM10011574_64740 [Microbispora bryophytorum]|uniref:Uncharacterized protein n=1 Tax=Microbispora bryophytorum TaxID=1460882 RepID=A0A8H9H5E0_9ACTN|nr:hypothetical protein GCM10011574_64740 [Microbispora bryophytorum]